MREFPTIVNGEYVFSPCKNIDNQKTSYWLTRKGYTSALYCFSAMDPKEVSKQESGKALEGYIRCFEEKFINKGSKWAVISYYVGETGDTEVCLFDTEDLAKKAMLGLWEKSYNAALEDDDFSQEKSYHEEYFAQVTWNDGLYRYFEVQKVSDDFSL